ncbi:MAG: hypoxanthine phosphoribosyltransferase [Ignavibacteria bacterium]|jgi:hypoxanthine phosphoribosyltransferase
METINNKNEILIGNEVFKILLTEDEIQKRVKEIADDLTEKYKTKLPILIGILNGSFMFLSDLVKKMDIKCEIDFFKLSSYGDSKISSGQVKMLKELNADVKDRHLILVEDIVDSGLSMKYICELLGRYEPASISIVSLLYKPNCIKYDVKIDYIGFEIEDKFVIGYGLDYAQKYRNLKSIYVLSE